MGGGVIVAKLDRMGGVGVDDHEGIEREGGTGESNVRAGDGQKQCHQRRVSREMAQGLHDHHMKTYAGQNGSQSSRLASAILWPVVPIAKPYFGGCHHHS